MEAQVSPQAAGTAHFTTHVDTASSPSSADLAVELPSVSSATLTRAGFIARLLKATLAVGLAGVRSPCSGAPPSPTAPPPNTDDLAIRRPVQQWLSDLFGWMRRRWHLPAIGGAIVEDGQIVALVSTGTKKATTDDPVSDQDAFQLGSISKWITATLAGALIDKQLLRWDLTLGEAFPEFLPTMNASYRTATVLNLLTHTAGLPKNVPNVEQTLRSIRDICGGDLVRQRYLYAQEYLTSPSLFPVGAGDSYASGGMVVVAMAEKLLSTPYDRLLAAHVYEPLKFHCNVPTRPLTDDDHSLWEHRFDRPATTPEPVKPIGYDALLFSHTPGGGLNLCPLDFARFLMMHMQGTAQSKVLSAEGLRALHRPALVRDPASPNGSRPGRFPGAFAWETDWCRGRLALGHNGSNNHNFALGKACVDGPQRGWCLMTNADSVHSDYPRRVQEIIEWCDGQIRQAFVNRQI